MRRKKESVFQEYLAHLSDEDVILVNEFFLQFKQHINLALSEAAKIQHDFENALMYYNAVGVNVKEALSRLDLNNLGGFYAHPPTLYYALDDSAKIYPLSMNHGFMNVFRLSAILKDEVVPLLLQMALTFTIKRFPRFATTLKKGFFWHFLDATKQHYAIEKDEHLPCRPIKISTTSSKSFRVLYYDRRISVEFFHVLTDGHGGLIFLNTLVATYLTLLGKQVSESKTVLNINEVPNNEENANEFSRTIAKNSSGFKDKKALQMSGRLNSIRPTQILHFKLNSHALKEVAKSHGVTITAYCSALFFLASKHALEAVKGEVAIQVPVDMRKYYETKTLANFTMYAGLRLELEKITSFEEILPLVTTQLKEKATYEKMSEMMYSAHKMSKDVRIFPLFLKNPIAKIAFGILGEKLFTTTFSNLGLINAPVEFNEFIDSYDFVLGPPEMNRVALTLVTFNEFSTLSITKSTVDPSFEESLYALLKKDGLEIIIEGSEIYESKRRLPKQKRKKRLKT